MILPVTKATSIETRKNVAHQGIFSPSRGVSRCVSCNSIDSMGESQEIDGEVLHQVDRLGAGATYINLVFLPDRRDRTSE